VKKYLFGEEKFLYLTLPLKNNLHSKFLFIDYNKHSYNLT